MASADSGLRRVIVKRYVLMAAIVPLLFAVLGKTIFSIIHVSLPSLPLAGGLILRIMTIPMIFGEEKKAASESDLQWRRLLIQGNMAEETILCYRRSVGCL